MLTTSARVAPCARSSAPRPSKTPRLCSARVARWTAKQGCVAASLGVPLVRRSPSIRCARPVYAATARGRSLTPAAESFLGALREAAARVPHGAPGGTMA
ncbi:hypothetical protein ABZX77_10130 [Streptomyces sp. NPDC004237]|uniref:hypothetical protein n=1 Tax=Streptomyces sp. NPDC004237 TaxID=3154455 RepID=UPI0033AD0C4E